MDREEYQKMIAQRLGQIKAQHDQAITNWRQVSDRGDAIVQAICAAGIAYTATEHPTSQVVNAPLIAFSLGLVALLSATLLSYRDHARVEGIFKNQYDSFLPLTEEATWENDDAVNEAYTKGSEWIEKGNEYFNRKWYRKLILWLSYLGYLITIIGILSLMFTKL